MAKITSERGANRVLIVAGALVIVALVGVIIALLFTRREPEVIIQQPEPANRSVLITEDNLEEVLESMEEDGSRFAPTSYEVSMTTDWIFPNGTSPSSNAYVENVTDNETDVYFDLLLRDTEEVLYQSPVIPLGGALNNITLDRDLDAGAYSCVMIYHLVDENQVTLTTLRVGLNITVEN